MNFRDLNYLETVENLLESAGTPRGNPKAQKSNFMKFPAEASLDVLPKLYKVVVTPIGAKTLTQITLDGTAYSISPAISLTDPNKVTEAVRAIIENHTPEVLNPVVGALKDTVADEFVFFYVAKNVLTSIAAGGGETLSTLATIYLESRWRFQTTKAATGLSLTDGDGANAQTFAAGANNGEAVTNVTAALAAAGVTNFGVFAEDIPGTSDMWNTVYVEGKNVPFHIDGAVPTYIETIKNFKA